MKYKFNLTALLVLIALLAHSQNLKQKRIEKYGRLNPDWNIKGLIPNDNQELRNQQLPISINFRHELVLKSAQTITQRLDSTKLLAWNDTTNQWTYYSKKVNLYDADERNFQALSYVWVGTTSNWIPDWKQEYIFNGNGKVTQYLGYEWDKATNTWIPDWKEEYSFDTNGTVPQILNYDWDKSNNEWVLVWQFLYSYNTNGDVTQILDYYRDNNTYLWVLAWKYIYSFDSIGQQTQQLEYFLDEKTSEWVADSKIEYSYDENGNMPEYQVYNRNQTTNQLELDFRRTFSYDNLYTYNDLVLPSSVIWQDIYFNHMLTGQSTSMRSKNTNAWEPPIYKTNYFYSEQNTTSAKSINSNLFRIYPNPAIEYIQFDIQNKPVVINFELFDMQGRKLISKIIGNNEKINMEGFKSGLYLYKLNVDGKVQNGKLVKK